jgi:GGDEF domain-containing protein
VARTIGNCLKELAYAVAYAGDEFVVILPGHDQTQALQKASEIRSRMKDTVYVLDQSSAFYKIFTILSLINTISLHSLSILRSKPREKIPGTITIQRKDNEHDSETEENNRVFNPDRPHPQRIQCVCAGI